MTIENKEVNLAEKKLLESALALFSKKGYEGTSIREIIEGAGVTRPVLYYYFENKEDLFLRLVQSTFEEYVATLEPIHAHYTGSIGRLKAVMGTTFLFAEERPNAVRLILQTYFSSAHCDPKFNRTKLMRRRFQIVETVMQEGLEQGELAGGDAQSLALVFLGVVDMHVMAKTDHPNTHLTQELAEGLVDLFFYGACYKKQPPTALVSPYTGMH